MSKTNSAATKIAFAYLSFIVGAGFTTGQEILQYFVNYGQWSIAGAILAGVIVAVSTRQISKLGYLLDANTYDISLNKIFGRGLGRVIDYLIIFFLYGSAVIMIAGGGAAFNDGFGVPAWIGSLFMVIALFFILQIKFDNIISFLGYVTPFLIIAVLLIAGINILNPSVSFSEVGQYTDATRTPTGSWWWDAINYGGLIIGTSFSFLTIIGANAEHSKIARRGALYGGLIFSLLLVIMVAGLLTNINQANSVELPTLLMANEIHPALRILMAAVEYGRQIEPLVRSFEP